MKHEFERNGITSIVYNMDCMEGMKMFADKHFDLAVVDPPYGIGISSNPVRQQHNKKDWDKAIPTDEYFEQLFRVSKNQIIWGGNYFDLKPSQGFLIWDKKQPQDFSLAMCEYAWSSIQSPAKMFRYSVLTERDKIHPTQKPIQLYKWIFKNYAKQGDLIIDTHLGSQSSRIAAYEAGLNFVGFELDPEYFADGCKRFDNHVKQLKLF
jgi:site-specific DNA-methyltransferase (adenine-specific)